MQKSVRIALPETFGADAPAVSRSAMLVDMSLSVWTAIKRDRFASEKVTRDNNAARGVAAVQKKLLGDCAELDAVHKFAEGIRKVHRSLTLPWSDAGLRLLPTAQFFRYNEVMVECEAEFRRLVDCFLDAYDYEVADAKLKLGSLYDEAEYPSRQEVARKFAFRFSYVPLPSANDWRVDMEKQTRDALKTEYERYFAEQLDAAVTDLRERVRDTILTLARQLEPVAEGEKARRIYDSVVDRAKELVDMLRTCNVTNDAGLSSAYVELTQALDGVSADALRNDEACKAETKRKLDAALEKFPGLGW